MIASFFVLFLGSVLVSTPGVGDAQVTAPSDLEESETQEALPEAIGTVSEIKGQVRAVSDSQPEGRELSAGDPIYLNETITTEAESSVQIEFSDETLVSISAESSIQVSDLTYDEAAKDGSFTASVAKGIFRFISGKIAKAKPEKVNIEIPSGTIGIRGTIVVGEITGEKCLVTLEAEEGDKAQHRIVVSNKEGGQIQEVEITQPGFATIIEARGQIPKPVFELPEEDRNRFAKHLVPPKFLPRDSEGKPQHNELVHDPRRPGDVRQAGENLTNRPGLEPKAEGEVRKAPIKSDTGAKEDFSQIEDDDKKPVNGPFPPGPGQGPDGGNGLNGEGMGRGNLFDAGKLPPRVEGVGPGLSDPAKAGQRNNQPMPGEFANPVSPNGNNRFNSMMGQAGQKPAGFAPFGSFKPGAMPAGQGGFQPSFQGSQAGSPAQGPKGPGPDNAPRNPSPQPGPPPPPPDNSRR